ncbi:MAG: oxidoreductase [Janthinobacterium lividum]
MAAPVELGITAARPTTPIPGQRGYLGQEKAGDATSAYNATAFLMKMMMGKMATAALVTVQGVTNEGGVSPVGTVNVQQMVSQVDGYGNTEPHQVAFNLPYHRLQGGTNAVILDPQVGDIGVAVFASRDISTVKHTKASGLPGSKRRFDPSDGLYLGGFLNGTPTQWVQFLTDGVQLGAGGHTATLSSSGFAIQAPAVTHNGVNIGATHVHADPQGGVTEPPQ